MSDLISRKTAIDAVNRLSLGETDAVRLSMRIADYLNRIPPAQPTFDARDTQYNLPVGTDLISRQAALVAVKDALMVWSYMPEWRDEKILEAIAELPPAEPKRGKWIYHIDDLFPAESTMECNQCHAEQPLTCDDEFCPHCGAKMEVTE